MAYQNSLHTTVSKPIGLNGLPTDARSYYYDTTSFSYRPYNSTSEVLNYLVTAANRTGQFPIFINISGVIHEYWFKDNVSDLGLIEKNTDIIVSDATTTSKGIVQLAGDLAGTADNPTVPGLANKVDKISGKGLSTNDFTNTNLTNLNNQSGVNTGDETNSSIISKIGYTPENISNKDIANGYAGLDSSGKIPISLLYLTGSVIYKGTYDGTIITSDDSSLNGQPLPAASSANLGYYFIVTSAFTLDGVNYNPKDYIISDGTAGWSKIDNNNTISTVFGRVGNILAVSSDYSAYYPLLTGSYSDPSWITSLAYSKLTGTPTIYSFTGTSSQFTKGDGTYGTIISNLSGFTNDTGFITVSTTDILTNKSISGSTNTLTNIPNSALTNSSITINGSPISLGGSVTLGIISNITLTTPSVIFSTPINFTVSSGTATGALSLLNQSAYTILGNNTSLSTTPTFFQPVLASALFANQGTSSQVLYGNASGNPSWAAVVAPAGTLTGTTLASNVVTSSLTTVGTITTGTWNGSIISTPYGGTGLNTYTTGDILYASTTNTLSKLPIGNNGYILTVVSGLPSWVTSTYVSSVSGTTNRISSTGGLNPVIDISSSYIGQSSITTLGTISTGVWNGSVIGITYGGTGSSTQNFVDLSTNQSSIGGNKTFTGITNVQSIIPEFRLTTSSDSAYARFQRTTGSSNNLLQGKNQLMQSGGVGRAIRFTGSNKTYTGDDTGLPSGSSITMTISFVYRATSSGGLDFNFITIGNSGVFAVHFFGNILYVVSSSGNLMSATIPINSSWHGIIIAINGNQGNIYIDNVLTTTGTLSTTYNIVLGGSGYFKSTWNNTGSVDIDQTLIYNRVLSRTSGAGSSDEIAAIYNSGGFTATPPTSGLIRRYEFEEGTGSTTADINPNGTQYPLTLLNSPTWLSTGIVPISSISSEATFMTIYDGLTNAEKGIATWGDFNGRNQQQGKWFQWFQGVFYPLVTNNTGQWLFNPNNTSSTLPTIVSTIDIGGNVTIGTGYIGIYAAPTNGLLVQGNVGIGITSPTAWLHLPASTTSAGTSPIKLATGTLMSTAEAGAIEYDGTDLYYSTSTPTRRTVANLLAAQTFQNKTLTSSTNVLGGVTMTLGSDANYDMYYRNSSGVLTRLANGTTGQILTATSSAAPSWGITILSGSATLDFPSTSANSSSDLTITITGAALGDTVVLGVPNGSVVANSCYTAWVSSANTVTVRFSNYNAISASDPASGTFKVKVLQ